MSRPVSTACCDAAGMIDRVDGAHVIAVAVLFLPAVAQADAERGAEQRGFDVVNAQRVAAEQRLHAAAADQLRERPATPPVWTTTGPATTTTFWLLLDRVAHQRGGLPDRGFHLALRGDAVAT